MGALQRISVAYISLEALRLGCVAGRCARKRLQQPLDWGTYSCGDVVPLPSQRQATGQCGGCRRLRTARTVVDNNNDSGVPASSQPE